MSRTILVFTFLAALIFSGCSFSKPEPLNSNLPSMEGDWTISMTHSGGIIGLSRSVEISSDGKYIVTDDRSGKRVTGELASGELSVLKNIVINSEYLLMESRQPSGCADCFVYDLAIQGSGKKFNVQLDDISMPDSGMETLIIYLRNLIDSAL
ncbi:MAG TPA: hypothetical protein VFI68_07905, partial [Anaerolineales bacterium]|nr:hypothetical protein [Anaerolineales bacterium]